MSAPGFACGALEIALNRYLRLEPEALAECGRLKDRVIALHAAGPDWEFFLVPHAGGVQVLDAAPRKPDVRISAPLARLLARVLAGEDPAAGGIQVEGDAELLSRFRALLDRVGFDPGEWLAPWVGEAAAHRLHEGVRSLLSWGRRSAGTLALDTAEYLREESGDLAHRADAEAWMDQVDALRERVDRFAARLDRLARKGGA